MERRAAREHFKQYRATTPEVAQMVIPPGQHLRSGIQRRSDLHSKLLSFLERCCKAEIDYLKSIRVKAEVVREHDVVRLKVAMTDAHAVHVLHCRKNLSHTDLGITLWDTAHALNRVEKRATFAVLEGKISVVIIMHMFEELDNAI